MLQDKFGVLTKHAKNGNVLVFNAEIISKLAKHYSHKIVIAINKSGGEGGEHGEGIWKKANGDTSYKISESEHKKQDNKNFKEEENAPKGEDPLSLLPSLPSPLDDSTIYRKYSGSDIWACRDCRFTGDIWFMKKHPCKGQKETKRVG